MGMAWHRVSALEVSVPNVQISRKVLSICFKITSRALKSNPKKSVTTKKVLPGNNRL